MAEKKEPESGIAAITVPTPKPPYAMPKMVRGGDGKMHTIYIDPQTNQPISNLAGYTILDGNNYYQVTGAADKDKDGDVDPKETQKATDAALDRNGHTTAVDADHSGSTFSGSTNPMNNYGYQHKPGAVKYAGYIPGPLGMAAKAVNVGWNANNLAATNTARQMLGLPERTAKSTIGGLLRDNQGQVADVDINGNKYSVGFEAMSPAGKTNLTPNEARQRALTLGGITEDTTTPAKDSTLSRVEKATGISKGWLSRTLDKAIGVTPATTPTKSLPTFDSVANKASTATSTTIGTTNQEQSVPGTTVNGVGLASGLSAAQGRPNMPGASITGAIQKAVSETFGPGYSVSVTSGTESKGMAQVGSSRHKTGLAADFDVVDPSGKKVTDMNALNDMASKFAFDNPNAGIGFGKGYMTPGRMHLDITGQKKEWGAMNTVANMDPALKETIDAARLGYQPTPFSNAPAPTARPEQTSAFVSQDERDVDTGKVTNAVGNSLSVSNHKSVFDSISPSQKATAQAVQSAPSGTQKIGTSPAARAAMGLTNRTVAEKTAMARAIAGELSQSSLKALAANDPKALAEVGNMVATMENRAASKMATGIPGALQPSQYNSLMASNLATTNQNYAANKVALDNAIAAAYSGKAIPGVNYNSTNYFNPDVANPAWGNKLKDPSYVGQHVFGSLPEYSPDAAAKAAAAAMNTMAGTDYSPGKMRDDNVGTYSGMTGTAAHAGKTADDNVGGYGGGYSPGTGNAPGYGAGMGGGAGYSPGGMNSPSGSSSYGGGYGGRSGMTGTDSHPGKSADDHVGGSGYGGGSAGYGGSGTSSGGSAGMSGGGGYSPGGMGSPSGSSASSGSGGGLGRNSDGSGNGWGGRSGSV